MALVANSSTGSSFDVKPKNHYQFFFIIQVLSKLVKLMSYHASYPPFKRILVKQVINKFKRQNFGDIKKYFVSVTKPCHIDQFLEK